MMLTTTIDKPIHKPTGSTQAFFRRIQIIIPKIPSLRYDFAMMDLFLGLMTPSGEKAQQMVC